MSVLWLLAASTLLSEDLACISAGLLVVKGTVSFPEAAAACFAGIFIGDIWLFLTGRWIGRRALARWPFSKLVKAADLEKASRWFGQRGPSIVFASRFLPGSRLPTYLVAGALQTQFWKFTSYFALACLAWTPLLVGLAAIAGESARPLLESYSRYALPASAAVLYLLARIARPLFSYRGRRLLLSAWRRKTRWEFWPSWLLYPPIVLYILYLGIRHRSLALFTAANPSMPAGGFAGESKSGILRGLAGAAEYVADYAVVEPAINGADCALQIIQEKGWAYPVVLKPDVGERGTGVCIAESDHDVRDYFLTARGAIILQEHVPGLEYGVFYIRHPEEPKGFIYAITDKRFPSVAGDGRRTLEELILADERAVCMAPLHLQNHSKDLNRVPKEGEQVPLVRLGTHCRGSLFLEGISAWTPELEQKIDEISTAYSGFYFGRYDIRTPSVEDFKRGKNFKIVELNGVTSEATSMYDPAYGLLHAYRVLGTQWRIAFEIGAQNRKRGVRPVSLRSLLKSVRGRKDPLPAATNPWKKFQKEDILWN